MKTPIDILILLKYQNYNLQANKWCAKGVDLLASQRIERCSMSSEYAEESLQEIQDFIESASEFCVSSPREFRNVFQESTTPETKALVSQVWKLFIFSIFDT